MNEDIECRAIEKRDDQDRLIERRSQPINSGAAHCKDGPAVEKFDPASGKLISEIWINQMQGGRHRTGNLPAYIQIDSETNVIYNEEFLTHGYANRTDGGPTKICRNRNSGATSFIEYRVDSWLHRDGNLPAVAEYHENSQQVSRLEFYQRGELHCEAGPAMVEFDIQGAQTSSKYFRRGKEVTQILPKPTLSS